MGNQISLLFSAQTVKNSEKFDYLNLLITLKSAPVDLWNSDFYYTFYYTLIFYDCNLLFLLYIWKTTKLQKDQFTECL